jgi:hypothetical protein
MVMPMQLLRDFAGDACMDDATCMRQLITCCWSSDERTSFIYLLHRTRRKHDCSGPQQQGSNHLAQWFWHWLRRRLLLLPCRQRLTAPALLLLHLHRLEPALGGESHVPLLPWSVCVMHISPPLVAVHMHAICT